MNFIYTKLMTWILGEALAHSDRIKVAVAGFITTLVLNLAGSCAPCQAFLTPELVNKLSLSIAGLVVTLIAAISHRDVGAPGQVVPGAAEWTAPVDLPPAPDDALGVPGQVGGK